MRVLVITLIGILALSTTSVCAEEKGYTSSTMQASHELENLSKFHDLNSVFGDYTRGEITPGKEDFRETRKE